VTLKVPWTLTSIDFLQLASAFGLAVPFAMMIPALLTQEVDLPISAPTGREQVLQHQQEVTSRRRAKALPPSSAERRERFLRPWTAVHVGHDHAAPACASPGRGATVALPAPVMSASRPGKREGRRLRETSCQSFNGRGVRSARPASRDRLLAFERERHFDRRFGGRELSPAT
jgi:hypothetical protein